MRIRPKRIITSKKFGVSIFPSKTYETPSIGSTTLTVKINKTVSLIVKKKDVSFVDA
jgi:hypothetical protein